MDTGIYSGMKHAFSIDKKIRHIRYRILKFYGSTKNFVGIYNFEIKNIQRYINRLFMKKN